MLAGNGVCNSIDVVFLLVGTIIAEREWQMMFDELTFDFGNRLIGLNGTKSVGGTLLL